MVKPVRTIWIYNKGSNWLLLDTDDITPLYHVHWNTHTLPHMEVSPAQGQVRFPIGTAVFVPTKKAGFFTTASEIRLRLGSREISMNKQGGIFSTDKRPWESSSMGTLRWKGGVTATPFLRLADHNNHTIATYHSLAYTGRVTGKLDIFSDPMDQQTLDEVVVTGLAMISEQSSSMGQTAANLSAAGSC